MKFDTPATTNPIDRGLVVGRPHDRIDGPLKVSGKAPYAYERHDVAPDQAYGVILGAGIAKGRIARIDTREAEHAPGVLAVVTAANAGKVGKAKAITAKLMGGPKIDHYHQAIAIVVAESFEEARAASHLIRVRYDVEPGQYDLAAARDAAPIPTKSKGEAPATKVGDFEGAFASAAVSIDRTYTTPDQSHSGDGAVRDRGRLGRRPPHPLDVEPDDQLGAARPVRDLRLVEGQLPRGVVVRRRRLRLQAVDSQRRRDGGARRARPRSDRSRSRSPGRRSPTTPRIGRRPFSASASAPIATARSRPSPTSRGPATCRTANPRPR